MGYVRRTAGVSVWLTPSVLGRGVRALHTPGVSGTHTRGGASLRGVHSLDTPQRPARGCSAPRRPGALVGVDGATLI